MHCIVHHYSTLICQNFLKAIDCISLHDCWWPEDTRNQGPFSISDKTSCCKIPWSLEAVRLVSRIRENCNMAISDGKPPDYIPKMEAFFITHRNQRKQAYLYLSYKHLFVYLFVGFNQGFVHIFTRLYCLGGGGGFCTHTRTPLAKSLCTRDSSTAIFFLLLSDCSEIWQAPQQYCCRHARQITKRCDNSN